MCTGELLPSDSATSEDGDRCNKTIWGDKLCLKDYLTIHNLSIEWISQIIVIKIVNETTMNMNVII
jgi:hypothetical protein